MRLNLIALLMIWSLGQVSAFTYGQKITLNRTNSDLVSLLKELKEQSGYTFFYKKSEVHGVNGISINIKEGSLDDALSQILKNAEFTYEYFDKTVVLKRKKLENNLPTKENKRIMLGEATVSQQTIKGRVMDESGRALSGVTIRVKNKPNLSVISNDKGEFVLPITALNETILVTYIGYKNQEFKASLGKPIQIKLVSLQEEVEEVVVTGMMEFKKNSFSGASSNFKKEQLLAVGNTNVIQALKSLDPSFLVMENNLAGANPNAIPTIELRGTTSITSENLQSEFLDDPNQPLFILDGFQTTLRTILDLDMNRIESITILKDAASTAIYGSRASNGVVVVETVKPQPGELRLNYSADLNVEGADLRSYNMMNAAEKLEFERLSGVYREATADPIEQYAYYDRIYSERLENILRGVDTYWLDKPIRTGFAQRHALYAEGGSEAFIFNVGGNYKKNNAIMKGSGRDEWGARANLTYKNRKLRANNNLTVQGNAFSDSNYGSFSTWVNANPYYEGTDIYSPYLFEYEEKEYGRKTLVANPLYNANLTSFSRGNSWGITNNFQLQYDFNTQWRLSSGFQINKNNTITKAFVSPQSTNYLEVSPLNKGQYTYNSRNNISYSLHAMLTYANVFAKKHMLNGSARIEFADNTNGSEGYTAIGFPLSSNGNPAFAYGYATNGRPRAANSVSRRNSITATGTYSYDNRYNVDMSFNYDGSTSFGNQNLYSPFFSIGGSWNLHNESFLKGNSVVNRLRLRGNFGVTGNQNFPSTSSISTYSYLSLFNYIGQGVTLSTYKNEELEWQTTYQTSVGIDGTFLQNRLTLDLNAYHKKTNNVIVAVTLPLSTGLTAYPMNAGDLLVKGVEMTARYNVIYRPQDRFVWGIGLTGAANSQTYVGFNNTFASLNKSLQESESLQRYRDGYSPNDLWAVKSLGIDPATGQELFLKTDGTRTFNYATEDQVVVGNSNPTLQGVLSTNLSYKGFTLSAYIRYIWDQDVLNSALYNKVENISLSNAIQNNQDRRALYERWKNPGDVSEFKSISLTSNTNMSSRFIQQENSLNFESISLGYDFKDNLWIKSLGLSNLRITGYTSDVFKWSTVRRERGIDYPYAKTYSFSLNANF